MKEKDAHPKLDAAEGLGWSLWSRREFLSRMGGGIVVAFTCGESFACAEGQRSGRRQPEDFNAYLLVGEDGRVTCFTGKIEMGQGVITSLPQMLADELGVALDTVDIVMGDTDLCPWDMGTFGSLTTRVFGPQLRAAAAEAREVLVELAAETLQVAKDRLAVANGVVFDRNRPETKVTYAQLTQGKKVERHLEEKPGVKPVSELEIIGKGFLRRDSLEKVTGQAKYAGDMRLPGMLYAAIVRPPAHGAKRTQVDTTAVEAMEDVVVIKDGDLIAVLHEHPDGAKKALDQVKAEFDVPEAEVDDRSIFDHLLKVAPEARAVEEGGDLAAGEKDSSEIFEETYYDGYVSHAPIETHTAVANFEGDKVTVWASTQAPFLVKDAVVEALGMPPENVRVVTPFVGGGFGGKVQGRQAVEAARLAKLSGKPVQVAWSRAEEFFYDTFRPAAVVKVKSGADGDGRIHFWDYKVYFAGRRGSEHIYDVPNHSTLAYGEWGGAPPGAHPFAVGAWRAPACNTNAFARESQIDIMASKLGRDPVEFRLENLTDERMRRVLKAAADKFGWAPAKSPSGRGLGVACGIDADTYVAFIAEAVVDRETGKVQVKRVVCAQDMGLVVNPDGAKIQMEGCITMGMGYALSEEIHFKGGTIDEDNFDTYEIPRFSWLPNIETVILDIKDEPPHGGGEPAIIGMGAVIANSIFDATGARLTMMPMTPERVRGALAKAESV